MLFASSSAYDPGTRVLTVRYRNPSGTSWLSREFRDVPPDVAAALDRARPHLTAVLAERVYPHHAARRTGEQRWHEAEAARPATPTAETTVDAAHAEEAGPGPRRRQATGQATGQAPARTGAGTVHAPAPV